MFLPHGKIIEFLPGYYQAGRTWHCTKIWPNLLQPLHIININKVQPTLIPICHPCCYGDESGLGLHDIAVVSPRPSIPKMIDELHTANTIQAKSSNSKVKYGRHNNIDDHGSRRGDMVPLLAQRLHLMSCEAWSIPHWAMHNTSSRAAACRQGHQNRSKQPLKSCFELSLFNGITLTGADMRPLF